MTKQPVPSLSTEHYTLYMYLNLFTLTISHVIKIWKYFDYFFQCLSLMYICIMHLQLYCHQIQCMSFSCIQTASVVSAELEETDSNASALTVGDPEPPRKQFCFKNATFEVILQFSYILQ